MISSSALPLCSVLLRGPYLGGAQCLVVLQTTYLTCVFSCCVSAFGVLETAHWMCVFLVAHLNCLFRVAHLWCVYLVAHTMRIFAARVKVKRRVCVTSLVSLPGCHSRLLAATPVSSDTLYTRVSMWYVVQAFSRRTIMTTISTRNSSAIVANLFVTMVRPCVLIWTCMCVAVEGCVARSPAATSPCYIWDVGCKGKQDR